MLASAPLPALLWSVLAQLERAYIQGGAGSREVSSLDLWANLLRVLKETGTDLKTLPAILCLSRRAVRTRLATAVRVGCAQEEKNAGGEANVRRTARGSEIAVRWRSLQNLGEVEWRKEVGVERCEQLREALCRIVTALPLEHPHYPASYGPADASITGGNGSEWKPIPRTDRSAVTGLPLYALLSQSIVAFAIEYEKLSQVALSLSTDIIHGIPVEGRHLRELSSQVGVSALVRHGFLTVRGSRAAGMALLTAKGMAVREQYDRWVAAVERKWGDQFGNESVTALRQSLEAVTSVNRRPIEAISG